MPLQGLPPDLIASSLGKVIASSKESSDRSEFSNADIARSLLYMISNDIGQIASLYAMLHRVKTIYFGGFFLRHHPVSMHTVGYSVNYWSKGQGCQMRHVHMTFDFLLDEYMHLLTGTPFRGPDPRGVTVTGDICKYWLHHVIMYPSVRTNVQTLL